MLDEADIKITASGHAEFLEISSDEQASAFRKEVVIPYFKDIFKVNPALCIVSCRIVEGSRHKAH